MKLNNILQKTKNKAILNEIKRLPPIIASEERPYDLSVLSQQISENFSSLQNSYNQQTGNKPATNRQQTDNETNNKPATNRQQTDNNGFIGKTNRQQTDNETNNKPITNRQQTGNKPATIIPYAQLIGIQRNIIIFIYQNCKKHRSKTTEFLTLSILSEALETSVGAIKTSTQRLEKKGCLIRKEFKNGRGGCTKYELSEYLFQEILQYESSFGFNIIKEIDKDKTDNKPATNRQQTDNKLVAQPATFLPSSSSNKFTTTTREKEFFFENEIDITPLSSIGFKEHHLNQILNRTNLDQKTIQESINSFAFDIEHNRKVERIKGNPLNFFIGILVKGMPYAPPENYESPIDRALRIYLEKQKKLEEERQIREEEAFEISFKNWVVNISSDEKLHIFPDRYRYDKKTAEFLEESQLKQYFKENHWKKTVEENFY